MLCYLDSSQSSKIQHENNFKLRVCLQTLSHFTLLWTKIMINPTNPNNAASDSMNLCAWNQPPPLTILPSSSATFFSTAALLILDFHIRTYCRDFSAWKLQGFNGELHCGHTTSLIGAYPRGAKKHQAKNIHIAWAKSSAGFCGFSVDIVDEAANKSILLFLWFRDLKFKYTKYCQII